jgi:hypothetical protein
VNKFTYFEIEWSHEKIWIAEAKRVVQDVYARYEEAAAEVDIEVTSESDTALDLFQKLVSVVSGSPLL